MYQIPPIVVNLRSINQRFIPVYLASDTVYGQIEGKKQWYELNVVSGLIQTVEASEVLAKVRTWIEELLITSDGSSMPKRSEGAGTDCQGRTSVLAKLHANKLKVEPIQLGFNPTYGSVIPQDGLRFLAALMSHQVKGDEMVKGLRALGVKVDVKLQDNYLGGWNIECSTKRDLSIERLVHEIEEQRRE